MKFREINEELYKFNYSELQNIVKWIKLYQRDNIHNINDIKKYVGNHQDKLVNRKSYSVFRGIMLKDGEGYKNSYSLDRIEKEKEFIDVKGNVFSWTFNKKVARSFALGNRTWMDSKTAFTSIDKKFGYYGVILSHTFSMNEVILDFGFIDENNEYMKSLIAFPNEEEVIVVPKENATYKVVEIIR
jgi:hypothetical protein